MPTNTQVRQEITNQIVESIENGLLPPWRRTWRQCPNSGWATNVVSGKSYTGVNPILCMIASVKYGFQSKHWATFKQWKALKGSVMKRPDHVEAGTWGTKAVFFKPITKTKTDRHGEEIEDKFFILKQYTIFNVDQVEGDHLDHLRACFVANEIGIPVSESLDNHSAYLKGWLDRMKGDSGFIFRASSAASKATDYIMSFSRTEDDVPTVGTETPAVAAS